MEISKELIFNEKKMQILFNDEKLWPSFIGAKFDFEIKSEKSAMPVALWPEQVSYIKNKSHSTKEKVSKKRKLETLTEDENLDQNVNSSFKRTKNTGIDNAMGIMYNIIDSVIAWGQRILTIGYVRHDCENEAIEIIPHQDDNSHMEDNGIHVDTEENIISNTVCVTTDDNVSLQDMKNKIFSDLQARKFLVGPGDVYGADYSLYMPDEDPSTSHSIASVRVVQQTSISARDFLSYARVQTQVAKNIIIGFLNPDDNMKPAYVSFKFQRVSERL